MTDDERMTLKYLWESGESTARISEILCYTPHTIRRVAYQMGLDRRPHGGGHGRVVTDDQIREIRRMRESGHQYCDIGNAFGISHKLAWYYVNKFEFEDEDGGSECTQ